MIGERWTLLVLREAFLGVRRFDQLQRNTGIARNILSDRLNTLVLQGSSGRSATRSGRSGYEYRLTATGLDLYPVLLTIMDWGSKHATARPWADPQELRRRRDAALRVSRVRRAGGCARHARRPRRGALSKTASVCRAAHRARVRGSSRPRSPRCRTGRARSHSPPLSRPPAAGHGFRRCDDPGRRLRRLRRRNTFRSGYGLSFGSASSGTATSGPPAASARRFEDERR